MVKQIVLDRMINGGGENVYQGVALKRCDVATLSYRSSAALGDLESLTEKMHERLEWSDTDLLRALLVDENVRHW